MRTFNKLCLSLATLVPVAASAGVGHAGTVLTTASGPGGHRYELVASGGDWSDAHAAAGRAGGFLATIGDSAEQSAVESLLADAGAPTGAYWFGLHETATEGDYRTARGVAPAFTHWSAGEPNNLIGGGAGENSATVLWSNVGDPTFDRRGFWNDLPDGPGYPHVTSIYPDLVPKGYVVEFLGSGPNFDNGDGDAGVGANAVPLPAAAWSFPAGAVLAGWAIRRARRR